MPSAKVRHTLLCQAQLSLPNKSCDFTKGLSCTPGKNCLAIIDPSLWQPGQPKWCHHLTCNPAPAAGEHCPGRNSARFVLGGLTASGISLKQAMGRLLRPGPCRAAASSSAGAQLCSFGYCSAAATAGRLRMGKKSCSASRASLGAGCPKKQRRKKEETTSEYSLK